MNQALKNSQSPAKRYLKGKPEAEECYPFGDDCSVFKVRGKMYATFSLEGPHGESMNLKCDPDQALALRDVFAGVIPGYHMNKKHWNTVLLDGSVPQAEIERMIDHSYALVARSLKKLERQALVSLYGEDIIAL